MLAIKAKNIVKKYSLYDNKRNRLKEAFSLSGKKYHKDFYALNGLSFEVEKGECVGLIGLNGSGKSTLLKILAGVLTQSEGVLEINGTVSALLELGAGFNPEYTGLENIYLNAMVMGFTEEETRAKLKNILDFADIGDFINQPVKVYSSGMFVRLAFAVAINVEPDVLLIDEALSVGDIFFQQKCYQKMKTLAGKATVVFVSHDMNAMTKFCRRIILLNHGEIVFDGDPNEAITEYYKIKQGEVESYEVMTSCAEICSLEESVLESKFRTPKTESYSGKMDVVITRYGYSVNNILFSEKCQEGDLIQVSMMINSSVELEHVIVGYQIRDKYGNEIFGETSLTSPVVQYPVHQGQSIISFEFDWPEIREGDYFITLGIGNGMEVMNQVEECWVNNEIHLCASTQGKAIFGIFNRQMHNFKIQKIN